MIFTEQAPAPTTFAPRRSPQQFSVADGAATASHADPEAAVQENGMIVHSKVGVAADEAEQDENVDQEEESYGYYYGDHQDGNYKQPQQQQQQQQYPQEQYPPYSPEQVREKRHYHYKQETTAASSSIARVSCWNFIAMCLGITGTVLGAINFNAQNMTASPSTIMSGTGAGNMRDDSAQKDVKSTLDEILERGTLNCGLPFVNSPGFLVDVSTSPHEHDWMGFDIELCKALAAAIFDGKPNFVSVPLTGRNRWTALQSKDVDVVLRSTHTMERDVYMQQVGTGFSFSSPYFYDGMVFGGIPSFVQCAQDGNFTGPDCGLLRICIHAETTHYDIIRNLFPERHVRPMPDLESLYASLSDESCNVIAWESHGITPASVGSHGYLGPYELGTRQYSREPLAMVTRQGDVEWTDFVFWILQALLTAEEHGITQDTAQARMGTTQVFGDRFEHMFRHAIGASGNYGEIYSKTLETVVSRMGYNRLNHEGHDSSSGDVGLLYSFPFGSLRNVGPQIEHTSPTIRAIRDRGFLNCGINARNGFAKFSPTTKTWSGFDVDLCRALSAAIFQGADHRIVYTDLPAAQRFQVLGDGRVDVLARLTTWTMERDVQGFTFSPPYFHDGVMFAGIPPYATCAMNRDVASPECQDLKFCVLTESTAHDLVSSLFHERYYTTKLVFADVIAALKDRSCNAVAGGSLDVAVATVRQGGYMDEYQVGTASPEDSVSSIDTATVNDETPMMAMMTTEGTTLSSLMTANRLSQDPLSIVTRQDDVVWSDFVEWILRALIYAEENNITQATAIDMPQCMLFGPLYSEAFVHVVQAVGSYGEIYQRNFANIVPRAGRNKLNDQNGPQLFTIPGIEVITDG